MIKTILAAIVAGAFLISVPVRAEDKAPAAEKTEKAKKEKQDKKEKKEEGKKDEKAGGW